MIFQYLMEKIAIFGDAFAYVNLDWRTEILREKSRINTNDVQSSRTLNGEVKGIGKLSALGQHNGSEIIW